MSTSTRPEEQNIGMIKTIRLIALNNLVSIPNISSGEISYNNLVFAPGAAFDEIYHTAETGSFDEQESKSGAGYEWTKSLNFEIPKIRTEVIVKLKNFESRKNAALVTDFNNTSFLVFPLRILRKKQIPGQFASKNAILVQMAGQSVNESPVITDVP